MRIGLCFPLLAVLSITNPTRSASTPEPPAPQPALAVRAALDSSEHLLSDKQSEAALAAAERALAAASTGDMAGHARAHRQRALCYEALGHNDQALDAWRKAAEWARGVTMRPERIEALGGQVWLVARGDTATIGALIAAAESLGMAERARPLAAAAALSGASERGFRTRRFPEAGRFAAASLAITEKRAPASLDEARSLVALGNVTGARGDLDRARDYYQRSLAIREKLAPGSLLEATSLNNLGGILHRKGDPVGAQALHERALAIRERLAPGSLDVAGSLGNLGLATRARGRPDLARTYQERALAIQEKLAPNSLDLARSLTNLGNTATSLGDLDAAGGYQERARVLFEALAPGSIELAASLNGLGMVAENRSRLDAAQDFYVRSLEIKERLAPGSMDVARSLANLSNVASERGDLDGARDYGQRALAIYEKQGQGSPLHAGILANLAVNAWRGGDLETARDLEQRSLAIREKIDSTSVDVASSLSNLGIFASDRGELEAARAFHERALRIQEQKAPGSDEFAGALNNLGEVAEKRGDLDAARRYYQAALELKQHLGPRSLTLAVTLHNLGVLAARRAQLDSAEVWLADAWSIVRSQRSGVEGDEAGRGFSAIMYGYAADLALVRANRGETMAGLQVVEEARAQGLLQLLADRGLDQAGVDSSLWARYQEAERATQKASQQLATATMEADRFLRGIGGLAASGAPEGADKARREHEAAQSAYTQARLEQERLLREVRAAVPGLEPARLSIEEARRALPAGSVYLAWLVGDDESSLFVMPADPGRKPAAYKIALGIQQLGQRVDELRASIAAQYNGGAGGARPAGSGLATASHALYELLVPEAARADIGKAKRVILSPDGPLWELPFAALATGSGRSPKWLGIEKPLSYAPSLTVLALERSRSRPAAGTDVLVVGDPVFEPEPATLVASAAPPASVQRGERWKLVSDGTRIPPLPASGQESREVASLYGAQALLGRAATEEAVRGRLPKASVIHLATHGYFSTEFPLSSGVLLSLASGAPEARAHESDGLLQAWEFGRDLPLSADLVVLSACETGRGKRVRGEGLVGLTRSLQAAGARSVVATQWRVADESTAQLAASFHRQLIRGRDKDEALRLAMSETAAKAATRDPFYWAPFILTGDADRPLEARPGR